MGIVHAGKENGVSKDLPQRRQDGTAFCQVSKEEQTSQQREECAQVQCEWVAVWPEGNHYTRGIEITFR